MLDTTQKLITQAATKLKLDEGNTKLLLATNAEHEFEIKLDDNRKFHAYRVQHNNKFGPYKGGIRFHPEVDLDEARALATLMSFKAAAVGLPLGGGKGGVAVDPKTLSAAELEEVSRQYVRYLHPYIGPDKDIPAPDVNTNSTIIDWMVDEYEQLTGDTSRASFTGKSISAGGSLGRDAATGRGGVIALAKLLDELGLTGKELTVAVQGYGNVGSFFATVAAKDYPNWKLVAASDTSATLYDTTGLDAHALASHKSARGRFVDYSTKSLKVMDEDDILSLDVDVLVLAALGDVITDKNVGDVKAKYVVELANGPVSYEAIDKLTDKKVAILPGIVANAGGVIVSYLEWLQNKANETWSEDKVNTKLREYMEKAVVDMVETSRKYDVNLPEGAFILAIKKLNS